MKYSKGDLIAVKTLENKRVSCIIVALFSSNQFIYCYTIETGKYRLVYEKEIEFIISEGFDPDFPPDDELFNLDYSFYEACAQAFSYSPYFGYPYMTDFDEESTEDDE